MFSLYKHQQPCSQKVCESSLLQLVVVVVIMTEQRWKLLGCVVKLCWEVVTLLDYVNVVMLAQTTICFLVVLLPKHNNERFNQLYFVPERQLAHVLH